MRPGVLAALLILAGSAHAQEPAFREGDVVGHADVAKLEPFLPPEFWAHRELFFYEGMQLEIGPTQRDYSPAAAYVAATREFAGKAKLGPDGSLEGYVAGQPFPMEAIDCQRDPWAGTKIAWNFEYRWEGDGADGWSRLTYWDRGEQLPLSIEWWSKRVRFAHRLEKRHLEKDRHLLSKDPRILAEVLAIEEPADWRGHRQVFVRADASRGSFARSEGTRHGPTSLLSGASCARRTCTGPRRSPAPTSRSRRHAASRAPFRTIDGAAGVSAR